MIGRVDCRYVWILQGRKWKLRNMPDQHPGLRRDPKWGHNDVYTAKLKTKIAISKAMFFSLES
jgi:hypothetical protein